ncbi:MAG: HU family DNA-binding protein [Planctomycetota bacterium]|nr:HU family DNA-binding protein [Planctomycetota bacterium]
MNKMQLVEEVMKSTGTSRAQAERTINAVIAAIKKGVKKDKKVQIVGFGTFSVRTRKKRQGRNPRTGETIDIPASKTVAFKAGKSLKDEL